MLELTAEGPLDMTDSRSHGARTYELEVKLISCHLVPAHKATNYNTTATLPYNYNTQIAL